MEKKEVLKKVLFICTHNSARSHMAEGFMNALYSERYRAFSAGTEPSKVNPYVVRIMQEIGIDISDHRSKSVDEFMDQDLDYVVTVCDHAKEACPFFPGGRKTMHKGFQDPASVAGTEEKILALFRRVRPGLTGLWQVYGRGDLNFDERVRYDEYYVRNWSIWLDVYILLRTIWVVLRGEGAY